MAESSSTLPVKSLEEWHAPSFRPEKISELITGVDRYNPTNLPLLEEYLDSQMQDETYDLLANLAILKLYQFNPHISNPEIIINILIKSLSATVQGPDFNLCLSILRDPTAILHDIDSDEQSLLVVMPFLSHLHDLIRTCQFTSFWKEFNGPSEGAQAVQSHYSKQHPGLQSTFRSLFCTSISSCFSQIPVLRLQHWLDLPANEVESFCSEVGWTVKDGQAVIPGNGDNNVKASVVKETVELKQLTTLVSAAAF